MALGGGDRGEVEPVGDVADRIDMRDRTHQPVIDRDFALWPGLHAGGVQSEPGRVGGAAGGEKHQIDLQS